MDDDGSCIIFSSQSTQKQYSSLIIPAASDRASSIRFPASNAQMPHDETVTVLVMLGVAGATSNLPVHRYLYKYVPVGGPIIRCGTCGGIPVGTLD
jgi:hypothetical protein